jgi:hypothetical protein
MKIIKNLFKIAIIATLIWACTEEIDINLYSTYTRLVVFGEITTDTTQHSILLTKTMDYFEPKHPEGISNANLTITWKEGDQNLSLTLTECDTIKGKYLTPTNFFGIVNTWYTLTIENVDINGDGKFETYTAKSFIQPIIPIDSITCERFKMPPPLDTFRVYSINLFAQDPPTEDFYLYKWRRNDTLMTDSLHRWGLTNDIGINGTYIYNVPVFNFDEDDKIWMPVDGDTITLELSTLTKEYYQFLYETKQARGIQTPMTGTIPGNPHGNISNGALGYFATYGTTRATCIYRKKIDN